MVEVRDLVKVYPNGTRAVAGIDFDVPREEFFGFLGPNGAGKTTTMKILATLLRKTSGVVTVAGYDVDADSKAVRRSIGFAMQEVGLDDLATGRNFLQLQGVLYGLSRREARRRADELLDLVGLAHVAGQRVGTYSGGMRRRIDLVGALMHDPDLLFLDEPTVGLDPQSRLAMWEHLDALNAKGVTILLTTQVMEEADRLCRNIAIIDQGHIVAKGSPESLKSEVGGDVVQVVLNGSGDGPDDALNERAEGLVRQQRYVDAVNRADGGIAITVKNGSAAVPDLVSLLHDNRVPVASLSVAQAEPRRCLPQVHRPHHSGRRGHRRRGGRDDAAHDGPEEEVAPMNVARETYFIYMRNLKAWLGQPALVISTLVMSVFMFLFFGAPLSGMTSIPGFPSDDYYAYITGMIIVMSVVFNGADVAFALLTDMLSGYFDKLLLAPVNRFSILMGTLLVSGTRALVQVLAIVTMALALGVSFKGGLVGLVAIIAAATVFGIATACIGLIIALKTKSVQVTQNSWLMFMPLAFLTTAFMPKELLTGWFKWAVTLNPVDYVLVAVRTIIIDGWEWESILPGLWVLTATTVIMLAAATWTYRRATA